MVAAAAAVVVVVASPYHTLTLEQSHSEQFGKAPTADYYYFHTLILGGTQWRMDFVAVR